MGSSRSMDAASPATDTQPSTAFFASPMKRSATSTTSPTTAARVGGAEQRQHSAQESGEPRQPERGDRAEGEQPAEPRGPGVQRGAGLLGEGVEVGGARAVLQRADEEEEEAGDEAVGDVGEQRTV